MRQLLGLTWLDGQLIRVPLAFIGVFLEIDMRRIPCFLQERAASSPINEIIVTHLKVPRMILFGLERGNLSEISRTNPTRAIEPRTAVAYLLNEFPSPMTAQKNR